jgi:peptidoglycan/LPS O-acetylase OafA/YrhL
MAKAVAATTVWGSATSPRAGAPGHLPVLDGIRGLAILLVLVHHQTILRFTTPFDRIVFRLTDLGWCGVDLFFVLSGFLITGVLLDAKGSPHYFRNFYARRTLRIFPLYYAVVFFSLVILPRLPPWRTMILSGPLPADPEGIFYWLYLSNFLYIWHNEFTHPTLALSWSLAIEEQYYLVWAVVVWITGPARLMWICGALVITALILRTALVMADVPPIVPYVLPFARMDALAIGGFVALALRHDILLRRLRPIARVAAPLAAVVVFALWARDVRNDRWQEPLMQSVGYTVLAVLFGCLIVSAVSASPDARIVRVLSHPLLRSFGKYSYAMYLLHVPVQMFVQRAFFQPSPVPMILGSQFAPQLAFFVVATAGAWLVAWLSWHLYEKHFLTLKRHFSPGTPRGLEGAATGS